MPITAFNSFTDGLDPNRRSREHFIANLDLEDDRLWVPYADNVWFQPCRFNVTSGGFSVVLKGLRSEEHTSELQSRLHLVCRLLLEKKNNNNSRTHQQH